MAPKPLLASWLSLRGSITGAAEVVLFLDYDGTLAPIASHPSKARLPAGVKRTLCELARRPGISVSLVSGRALPDLRKMVKLPGLCYVGNHGLELDGCGMKYLNPMARSSQPVLRRIAQALKRQMRKIRGAWVEDKGYTLSVHSRMVAPQDKILVRNAFYGVVRPYQEKKKVRVTAGKEVFEVRPPVRWTKGTMVRWLLGRREALAGGDVVPVYIGDDVTDEDAFEVLRRSGITVAVGPSSPLTHARYCVKTPADVERFLRLVLQARRPRPLKPVFPGRRS